MRKLVILGASVAALALPTVAMAAPASPGNQLNPNSPAGADLIATGDLSALSEGQFKGSLMGEYMSRVTHSGYQASTQAHSDVQSRSAAVQAVHLLEGTGSLAK